MTDFAARRRMMVDTQVRPSDVTKFPIIDAMLNVPREDYVPTALRATAYVGENLDLGGRRVVLEPRTFAKMLDGVSIRPGEVVLDIGPGFGYSTAVIARLAEAVVAVEPDPAMAKEAEQALAAAGVDNAAVIEGTLADGAPKHGPYDVILIEGGVEEVPQAILEQLRDEGRIAALFQIGALGVCRFGYKLDGQMSWRFGFNAGAPVLPGFERAPTFQF
jgi:protein-L-isoaspartate(D-aspartate) O-methyltransferase